jgi:hypothetical protein
MRRIPRVVLDAGARLFWDVDVKALDPEQHEAFILARVLCEGDWQTVRAVRAEVGDGALRALLDDAPHRLDERTRRFLEVVLPPSKEPCTKKPFRRTSGALFSP